MLRPSCWGGADMNTPGYEVTGNTSDGAVLPDLPIRCFFAGTLIGAAEGERPVEALRPGDLVRTVDGTLRPVRWIGHSVVSRRFADPLWVLPIRIRAGALGEGVPT